MQSEAVIKLVGDALRDPDHLNSDKHLEIVIEPILRCTGAKIK